MKIEYYRDGYSPWAVAPDGALVMMMSEKMPKRLELDSNPWLPCITAKDLSISIYKYADLKFLPCIYKSGSNRSNAAQLNLRVREEYLDPENPIRQQLLEWENSQARDRFHWESIEAALNAGSDLVITAEDEVALSSGVEVWDLRMSHYVFRRVPAFLLVEETN